MVRGVGGGDRGLVVDGHWYPVYSVQPMVRYVKKTPVVDGAGLKNTLEKRIVPFMQAHIGDYLKDKKAFIVSGADRWGLSKSFLDGGYDCIFGDIMFGLGLPFPVRGEANIKRLARILMPVAGRLPFKWVYPTGEKQEVRIPRWESYYRWATVIAGDCLYIKHHLPAGLDGRVVATNTTTFADVDLFRQAGIKYLITSTPVLDGRSFGTNMMEAALIAVSGKGRKLSFDELDQLLDQLGFEPQLQELN